MRHPVRSSLVAASLARAAMALPSSASAQQAPATIDPGMTRAQVVAKLGAPLSSRSFEGFTYLLYRNGCEKTCGMNDLVVLDSDKVVDAVFRTPARKYTGTSSSPRMIPRTEAARDAKPAARPPSTPITIKKPAR